MALIKSVIRTQPFNQRIAFPLQVMAIVWLLWQPIHCDINRVNGGNRSTYGTGRYLNLNSFDPLPNTYATHPTSATHGHPSKHHANSSSTLDNYNLNYLLSVLSEEERQAIFRNVIHHKSDTSEPPTLVPNDKRDDTMPNHIDLALEERQDLHDANKLFSPSLNVIDVSPQDTQLAHSVLLIHKPKPNKTLEKPSIASQFLIPEAVIYSNVITGHVVPTVTNKTNKTSSHTTATTPATTPATTTTESYPTPVRNNHKPLFLRPFPGLKRKTTPVPTTVSIVTKTSPSKTSIYSTNASPDSTTFATTDPSEEFPIIFNNNHKKQSFPMFTRQKFTTTEFALIFTTPDTMIDEDSDKSTFTEVPKTATAAYTYRPPYMTTLSHLKRPPMKVMTVNANRVRVPEEIFSDGITVLDPPFISGHPMKLPPNTTVIHKNLIVPMKEGRPKPVFPMSSTTQYPIYPVVAGVTKWHTDPTTPWAIPLVTTSSSIDYSTPFTSTVPDMSETDISVTAQSMNRPTVISGHPFASTTGQTSHLVTVTPIKSAAEPSASGSNTFLVTSAQTPRPSTSTTGYVNAIWAPPMPIARPVQPVQAQPAGGWFAPVSNIFSVDPSSGGSMFSFMSIMKTVVFTILVFFLPPITLAAALLQTAVG